MEFQFLLIDIFISSFSIWENFSFIIVWSLLATLSISFSSNNYIEPSSAVTAYSRYVPEFSGVRLLLILSCTLMCQSLIKTTSQSSFLSHKVITIVTDKKSDLQKWSWFPFMVNLIFLLGFVFINPLIPYSGVF